MATTGNIYVVRGDISRCGGSAVIYSTSTALDGSGELFSSFSKWPPFKPWYSELRRSKVPREIGDTDWLPPHEDKPGVVLVRSVGKTNPRDPARQTVRVLTEALNRAEVEVRATGKPGPWLVLVPALLTGQGGGHDQRFKIARRAIKTANAFIQRAPDFDVAFVLYTPSNYALYREARRSLGLAPRDRQLESTPELTDAVAAGECVVFVGSGVSASAGMPGWNVLIRRLARHAQIPCSEALPYQEKLRIAEQYRDSWAQRNLPDVPTVVHEVFGRAPVPVLTHYLLAQLESRFLFTTNYDRLLEETLQAIKRTWWRVAHAHDVPATSRAGVTQVIKLHGDAAAPRERADNDVYRDVVLSERDYDEFVTNRAAFDLLLSGLMLNHTFLFVGYSLSDENVKATWMQILKAINHRPAEAGRHRRAYGLAYFGTGDPIAGLEWIANPGSDETSRTRAQWRLLDALAEHVAEPTQILAEDAPDDPVLTSVRRALKDAASAVSKTLARSKKLSRTRTRTLARVTELLYELGWKPPNGERDFWELLADAASDRPSEQRALLELALAHSRSAAVAERLRRRLLSLPRRSD